MLKLLYRMLQLSNAALLRCRRLSHTSDRLDHPMLQMVSTSSQRNDTITVEVPAISKASRLPSSQQWVSSSVSALCLALIAALC